MSTFEQLQKELDKLNKRGGIDSSIVAARAQLIQSSAAFTANFIPPDYLIDGFLQHRYLYSFTGRTGEGKTAISLLLMSLIALGRPLGERGIDKGRCLMFAGENPDDVRARWIAMGQQLDFDLDTVDAHFIDGTFSIPELLPRIKEEIETIGNIDLLIVDTSAAYFEGENENDNVDAGKHAAMLRQLTALPGGPCVIVNCHPTKNATDDNIVPRGGGALLAAVDGNLIVKKDDTTVELSVGKIRGPEFAPIHFELRTVTHERLKDSKGRLIKTVVARCITDQAKEDMERAARSDEDQFLLAIEDDGKISSSSLAQRLGWLFSDGRPYKSKVERIKKRLKASKLVTHERGEFGLTEKGERVVKKLKNPEN